MMPILMLFFTLAGCNSSDERSEATEPLPARELMGVSYGSDAAQKMDVYLPEGRNSQTKVFVLVHGGGWSGGSRADFNYVIPLLKQQFPGHAIINLDYRLATASSPAFPKQIEDIQAAIDFVRGSDYSVSEDYAFIGASAGAHLSMLYAYKYDTAHNVKAICNIVGPSDFTDPYYTSHPYYQYAALYLLGNTATQPNAAMAISPAVYVTPESPQTIMFYGGQDQLVPVSQAVRLKEKLDENNVYNEYYLYSNGGHGNWNATVTADFQEKLLSFFRERF